MHKRHFHCFGVPVVFLRLKVWKRKKKKRWKVCNFFFSQKKRISLRIVSSFACALIWFPFIKMPSWERDVTFQTSQEWPPPSFSWQPTGAKTLFLLLLTFITIVTIALVNLCLWLLKAGESLENSQALGCVGVCSITGISYHVQSHLCSQMSKWSEQNYGGKCGFFELLPNTSPRLITPCKLECKLEWNILMVDNIDCNWIVCHFRNGQWNSPSTGDHALVIQKICFKAALNFCFPLLSPFTSALYRITCLPNLPSLVRFSSFFLFNGQDCAVSQKSN